MPTRLPGAPRAIVRDARQGHPISFWRLTRYGLVVTAVTVLLAWPYLWLRYFVLA